MIDKKSRIFFGALSFLIMISIVITFYRYVILKDYEISTDEKAFNQVMLEE